MPTSESCRDSSPAPATPSPVDRLGQWVDRHQRAVQYSFYALGVTGLILCGRSLRLGTRFEAVSQIPASYFRRHLRLNGVVKTIKVLSAESHGDNLLLEVTHCPILSGFRWRPPRPLPVLCAALQLEAQDHGQNLQDKEAALQAALVQEKIQFRLLRTESRLDDVAGGGEVILALVELKQSLFRPRQSLGVRLVSLGHAVPSAYHMDLEGVRPYETYYRQLLKAEDLALKNQRGIWRDASPPQVGWLRSLWRKIFP